MAIDPSTEYPAQVETGDSDYPYGKARNDITEDDGTGTPFEEKWLNDFFGFGQALLDHVGDTPDGVSESISSSQYLDAIIDIVHLEIEAGGEFELDGDLIFTGNGQSIEIGDDTDAVLLDIRNASGITMRAGSQIYVLGDVLLAGESMTMYTPLVCETMGRVVPRVVMVPDSNQTYTISDGSVFIVGQETLTGTATYTLGTTDAQAGDEIEFITLCDAAYAIFNGVYHVYASGNVYATRWRYVGDAYTLWAQVGSSSLP